MAEIRKAPMMVPAPKAPAATPAAACATRRIVLQQSPTEGWRATEVPADGLTPRDVMHVQRALELKRRSWKLDQRKAALEGAPKENAQ